MAPISARARSRSITPAADFYRIDTALSVPQINPATWRLRIHGLVDKPIELSYADLLARPLIERWITLACVSREVGGDEDDLIGNARFLGAPLADILREAGVHAAPTNWCARSSDGMTIGAPTAVVMDGRDAMLAVGMNGDPLPVEHGFPVRMVVPGLYGYVSACKWIVDIEATTFSAFNAYWVAEGWNQQGPIVVSSRIDTPRSSAQVQVGPPVAVAGVAWEQHVGVSKVEVQVDNGSWVEPGWRPSRRSTPGSSGSTAGRRRRRACTPCGYGRPMPRGCCSRVPARNRIRGPASGWHTISVNVR